MPFLPRFARRANTTTNSMGLCLTNVVGSTLDSWPAEGRQPSESRNAENTTEFDKTRRADAPPLARGQGLRCRRPWKLRPPALPADLESNVRQRTLCARRTLSNHMLCSDPLDSSYFIGFRSLHHGMCIALQGRSRTRSERPTGDEMQGGNHGFQNTARRNGVYFRKRLHLRVEPGQAANTARTIG